MIRSFRHRGLKRLYQRADPRRIHPDHRDRVTDVLAHLDQAQDATDLDLPGYRLHSLKGDLRGFWSVTISGNWRVIFRFEDGNALDIDFVDYH